MPRTQKEKKVGSQEGEKVCVKDGSWEVEDPPFSGGL